MKFDEEVKMKKCCEGKQNKEEVFRIDLDNQKVSKVVRKICPFCGRIKEEIAPEK